MLISAEYYSTLKLPMSNPFDYNATLSQSVDVADTLRIIKVKMDTPHPPFKPGQFVMVGLTPETPRYEKAEPEVVKRKPTDKIIRRAYSICSNPNDTHSYELYLSLVKSGELTPRLWRLKEGDRLWCSGKPAGVFSIQSVPIERGLLFFCTGTGIAPFMSMIRTARREKSTRKITLVHAVDVSAHLAYRKELEAYATENPNFHYLPVITFPDRDPKWTGLTGWIQDDIRNGTYEKKIRAPILPDGMHVLLCGNPAMIKSAIEALREKGYVQGKSNDPTASIYIEEYW